MQTFAACLIGFDRDQSETFTIRIFSNSGDLLGQHTVDSQQRGPGPAVDPEPIAQASAQIHSYESVLRDLAGSGHESVRLEIIPANPASRFWAFMSVINNEAQHVSIITPE